MKKGTSIKTFFAVKAERWYCYKKWSFICQFHHPAQLSYFCSWSLFWIWQLKRFLTVQLSSYSGRHPSHWWLTNHMKTEKQLAVIRAFEDGVGPRTRLQDMPLCSCGTSEVIFNDIDAVFTTLNILWINCIGFSSDNCNVMVGEGKSQYLPRWSSRILMYWLHLQSCCSWQFQ